MGKGAVEAAAEESEAQWRREPRWWWRVAEGREGKGKGGYAGGVGRAAVAVGHERVTWEGKRGQAAGGEGWRCAVGGHPIPFEIAPTGTHEATYHQRFRPLEAELGSALVGLPALPPRLLGSSLAGERGEGKRGERVP